MISAELMRAHLADGAILVLPMGYEVNPCDSHSAEYSAARTNGRYTDQREVPT